MLRPLATATLVTALVVASLATGLSLPEADATPHAKPLGQMIYEAQFAHARTEDHPEDLALPPVDRVAEARRILRDEAAAGATPVDWVRTAEAARLLALRPEGPSGGHDLVAETLRINALLNVPVSAADVASMRDQAAALPADVRAAFADLVAAVADAHEAQALLALQMPARLRTADPETTPLLTQEERDATLARAEIILARQNVLRDVLGDHLAGPSPALSPFSDPEGLVIFGPTNDTTYWRSGIIADPVVLVDPVGNDTYRNSAGGACPVNFIGLTGIACNLLPVSVVVDLAGNDRYLYDSVNSVVQGAGAFGGLGILVDAAGVDEYYSKHTRAGYWWLFSYIDGVAQGAGQAGVGILVDAAGADSYRADVRSTSGIDVWNFAQGFGGAGGLGIAADGGGNDQWLSNGLGLTGAGFQGVYTNGVGFYGGVGILSDTGGSSDIYHATNTAQTTDYYAQGFGAFGGVGILHEDGGDDDYEATHDSSNPWIVPLLNCAYGTGSFGGLGVLLDLGGDDDYYGNSYSPYAAYTMNEGFGGPGAAYGIFVDVSGEDGHFMYADGGAGSRTMGRGVILKNTTLANNLAGFYLDIGGVDQYQGAWPSGDNKVWATGADINAPIILSAHDFLYGE